MTMTSQSTSDPRAERERYIRAFNDTMVRIWKEKIQMLAVIDSGRLYNSVVGVSVNADQKITSVELSQQFAVYGVYQERGTGSNTPKGNPGDIGGANRRVKKPWFTRKHLASMFNIREFFADSLGQEACTVISNALDKDPQIVSNSVF